jgi:hypothetical protein
MDQNDHQQNSFISNFIYLFIYFYGLFGDTLNNSDDNKQQI